MQAFADYGVNLAVLPETEAIAVLKMRSIRLELARSLDLWSSRRREASGESPDWMQLLKLARLLEPDPWRDQVRDALERENPRALINLVASVDVRQVPPSSLNFLAHGVPVAAYGDVSRCTIEDDKLAGYARLCDRHAGGEYCLT